MNARASEIIAAAETYRILGLYCVPIEPGTKGPKIKEWGKLRIEPDDFPKYWRNGQSAGVLLGIASRFLADADLDDPLAVAIVNQGLIPLPKTGWIFGRPSKQRSHYIYETTGEFSPKAYEDEIDVEANRARGESDAHMICELRGTKQQTVFPPSRHPSGEQIAWTQDPRKCAPAKSNAAEIEGRLRRIAVAVLLARHYPARNKGHEVAHYFSGWLGHACGWAESDVAEIIFAAATAAGDPDARERIRNVGSTYKRIAAGNEQIKQRSSLENLLGQNGPSVCRKIAQWLVLKSAHRTTTARATREAGDEPSGSFYGDTIPKAKAKSTIEDERLEIMCVDANTVKTKAVEWLVPNSIPIGTGSVVCGPAGIGKSTLITDWIACGIRGTTWPDGSENTIGPFDVIMLVGEEDLETMVKPRLLAAGATEEDLKRVHFATQTKVSRGAEQSERDIALDTDMAAVEATLDVYPQTKWIITDPLAGYLGHTKKHEDEKIRKILTAARMMAERHLIASTTVDHFNKNFQQDAISRLSGAGSLVQVPRIVWGVIADKSDPEHRTKLLLPIKANILSDDKKIGRKFRTDNVDVPAEDGKIARVGKVVWLGNCSDTIDDLLQQDSDPKEKRRQKAARFLREFLADGPRMAEDVETAAANKGLARAALWEAKPDTRFRTYRPAGSRVWYWEIPASDVPEE